MIHTKICIKFDKLASAVFKRDYPRDKDFEQLIEGLNNSNMTHASLTIIHQTSKHCKYVKNDQRKHILDYYSYSFSKDPGNNEKSGIIFYNRLFFLCAADTEDLLGFYGY